MLAEIDGKLKDLRHDEIAKRNLEAQQSKNSEFLQFLKSGFINIPYDDRFLEKIIAAYKSS